MIKIKTIKNAYIDKMIIGKIKRQDATIGKEQEVSDDSLSESFMTDDSE